MRSIAIANQKGGTGKTATAVNLAACLGELDRQVLLVDLDPQANATASLGVHVPGDGKQILEMYLDRKAISPFVQDTATPNVSILPASSWLVGAERMMGAEVAPQTILRQGLDSVRTTKWQYVLIDCPPTLGLLTVNALVAADEVLVPVEASSQPLAGLKELLQTVDTVRRSGLNADLVIRNVVVCRYDRTRIAGQVAVALRERFGSAARDAVIREDVRLREAPSYGEPITRYAPESRAAKDYRALAAEIVAQEGEGCSA